MGSHQDPTDLGPIRDGSHATDKLKVDLFIWVFAVPGTKQKKLCHWPSHLVLFNLTLVYLTDQHII